MHLFAQTAPQITAMTAGRMLLRNGASAALSTADTAGGEAAQISTSPLFAIYSHNGNNNNITLNTLTSQCESHKSNTDRTDCAKHWHSARHEGVSCCARAQCRQRSPQCVCLESRL